jgi:hypothetical protein
VKFGVQSTFGPPNTAGKSPFFFAGLLRYDELSGELRRSLIALILLLDRNGPIDTALRSGFDCSGRLS